MKRLLYVLFLVPALLLGGCAYLGDIANPVQPVNIYQAKSVYAATLQVVVGYREYCFPTKPFKSYATLMADPIAGPVCKDRRRNMRAAQNADDNAFAAITRAETFVRNNPTINASTVIREAIAAVMEFSNVASRTATTIAAAK